MTSSLPASRTSATGLPRLLAQGLVLFALMFAPLSKALADPALWRATNGQAQVWLFATLHALPPGLDWRSEAVLRAFANAGTVALEAPSQVSDDQAADIARTYGLNPLGRTTRELLLPEDQARLDRIIAARGLNAQGLNALRPWLGAISIRAAFEAQGTISADLGADRLLEDQARRMNKWVIFLETPAEQASAFASLAPNQEAEFLAHTLRSAEDAPLDHQRLGRAWADGDLATMDEILNARWRSQAQASYARVVVYRSMRFVDTLLALSQSDSNVFVGIGAAHMVGPNSVPELLTLRGWTVERVPAEPISPTVQSPPPGMREPQGERSYPPLRR